MTLHRRGLLTLGAGMALAGGWSAARAADAPAASADVISTILAETGAPALVGAVVTAKGVTHFETGGVRRIGAPDKVTRDDLWHLGSNTKAMTAALYGRLVEKGQARWGATVPELFPDLTVDPAWSKTTIEQLLGHRAGIDDRAIFGSGWLMLAHRDTRPLREQRSALAKTVFGAAPGAPQGAMLYSNVGYVLVGAAIERMANATWEDAVTADLFRPLGITTAGFGPPLGAQPWGHRPSTAGAVALPITGLIPADPAGPAPADNPPAVGPAGRAHMTIDDYAKFVRIFLTNGAGVLKPETVTRLITPVPGEGRGYALGWGVAEAPWAKGPLLAHDGSNTMWHVTARVAPGRGVAIIAASNAPPPLTAATRLAKSLQERFAPA